eukprot:scaffold30805_cov18-Tisochrysis_lutea.AAC.1
MQLAARMKELHADAQLAPCILHVAPCKHSRHVRATCRCATCSLHPMLCAVPVNRCSTSNDSGKAFHA